MFYSADMRHERFGPVGIARYAVFFHSFVASRARKGRSEKRGGAKDRLPKMSTKFAPRLRARAISAKKRHHAAWSERFWKLRSAKFAPRLRARAIDLEVNIVKNGRSRRIFGSSKWFSRGRRRDFDTLQNTWQAQEFVRVAKTLAGVVDLKRVWNDAFRVAGARISCFAMSMFEASDAESVEGLQISCDGSVTLQWLFRVAVTGVCMPRLNFFVAGAVLLKHPLKNR